MMLHRLCALCVCMFVLVVLYAYVFYVCYLHDLYVGGVRTCQSISFHINTHKCGHSINNMLHMLFKH